ncbi:hypothetical protein [Halobacillus yeomjeoni]|uniref:Uncharacterized protein n=1 Tax=Halobacillus yeomjeoni TaxID=311194 RepID=A0A931HUK5_9BACI|nr:hypothetical protein [Halobacillus yeomjeoni]MBH0229698.1 hypothetical protein [Halobacillus yeomjeoni]
MSSCIITLLFGGIYLSGWFVGVDWGDYNLKFSWNMFNSEELRQLVGMKPMGK